MREVPAGRGDSASWPTNSSLLVAQGVGKHFGSIQALADVTFELGSGIAALVGVNGAGKSTLLTVLAGALRPDKGGVRVSGDDLYTRGTRPRALRRVAFMPQLPLFPKNLTAHEVVTYLCWMRGARHQDAVSRADAALDQVGLAAQRDTKIGRLSGGMLRRVALAQAIAGQPEVLLLDEPSTGLDPRQRRTMVDLLTDLPGTVLISSHVMEDVTDLAQRVLVLHEGTLRFDGGLDALRALAPESASTGRQLEAGFLSLCLQRPA